MLKNKKALLLVLVLALLIVIPIIAYFILSINSSQTKRNNLSIYVREQKFQEYVPLDKLEKSLAIIENPKSSQQQSYTEAKKISYELQDYYYRENDPKIRTILAELEEKAKAAFPKEYDQEDFVAACADSECGEKPDEEAKRILESVENLKTDSLYIRVITTNLENAILVPYKTTSDKVDKLSLYNLAYIQLLELGIPEASSSAENLNLYVKNKYKADIEDIKGFAESL